MKLLYKILTVSAIAVMLFSACTNGNGSTSTPANTPPAITQTYTPSNTPTFTPSPTDTPTPVLYQLSFQAFHDYNGNGTMDEGEPTLEGILNKISAGECTTGVDGKCEIEGVPAGSYNVSVTDDRNVEKYEKMRFILPSVAEVRTINQGLDVVVDGDEVVLVPLGQGFLTLPFEAGTHFDLFSFYDLDPRYDYVRNYRTESTIYQLGPRHTNDTARGHNGIDYNMPEGNKIITAAPGRVIGVGDIFPDCPGMLLVRIQHIGGLITHYAHLSSTNVVLDQKVNRGDLIGLSGNSGGAVCSSRPHLHFGLSPKNYTNDNNITIDPYRDEIDQSGSPGYWTVDNAPQFYK